MTAIRTVLGDIEPDRLGVCNAHDHLFLRSRALPGQELDDEAAAARELRAYADAGGEAVVQWTPGGMRRHAPVLPELSRSTGVHLVAATGLHQRRHYDEAVLPELMRALPDRFVTDLTTGIDGGPRAGLIKVAGGFHGLDRHARETMAAAAQAHHATGAPIGVHLELGTGAMDVLDLLCGQSQVPPQRVLLGHLNRAPDPRMHAEAAASGAFLAFDGPSRTNHATDWRLLDVLGALFEAGHANQVLLGGDTTTAGARGNPGMPYLLRKLAPKLERHWGAPIVRQVLRENPARAFGVDWR